MKNKVRITSQRLLRIFKKQRGTWILKRTGQLCYKGTSLTTYSIIGSREVKGWDWIKFFVEEGFIVCKDYIEIFGEAMNGNDKTYNNPGKQEMKSRSSRNVNKAYDRYKRSQDKLVRLMTKAKR